MTVIKICGLKYEEDVLATAEAGADFIGLMFASSPRQITPAAAAKLTSALKKAKAKVKTVGVFVNTPAPTARKIAEACRLDWIQLSGDEPWEYCQELTRPVIKVVKIGLNTRPRTVISQMNEGAALLGKQKHIFLLDASVKDKYGGTGVPFDWNLARPVSEKFEVLIAGGLRPDNVKRAIKTLKPWGVDVSSGVETRGAKDIKKIIKFIEAVKEADAGDKK
jgi:phosphoribosylanthranilate isomerase